MTKQAMTTKQKTFQAGEDFGEVSSFFHNNIETIEDQPEGTDWSGGEPGPYDPSCETKYKYTIKIIRHEIKPEEATGTL